MCSPSPPPPPDYAGAAQATAAGNLETARAASAANRVKQVTPYGTLSWNQTPTQTLDAKAYEKAYAAYKAGETDVAPDPAEYQSYNPDAGWEQTVSLTPEAQQTLNEQMALNRKYGETANVGFDRVRDLFENPQLDTSGLPNRAIDVGQTAQQAIMSRLNPQMQQRENELMQRLANQGIGLGSEAYGREMNLYSQARNDAEMQAALQGINLDQANRAAALQEQAYMQDRPLNLINALRTGAQVQNPQFQQFAQQATTAGPDMLGAAKAQYAGDMAAYNANQAASSGLMGGLFNVGMGLARLPGANGSMIAGAKGLFA